MKKIAKKQPKAKDLTDRQVKALLDHDEINKSQHYNSHPSGVECIEIVRHENFNCGNAIKYIWRRGEKECPIKDLKKAAYYIADEIKRLENEKLTPLK